jgi:hypothetical protein
MSILLTINSVIHDKKECKKDVNIMPYMKKEGIFWVLSFHLWLRYVLYDVWMMLGVFLVTQEAEIRRIKVQSQTRQIVQ